MLASTLIISVCVILLVRINASNVINLNGIWMVSNVNKGIKINGSVPGSMYTALHNKGLIHDPYYRNNSDVYSWIGREDWTYSRTFNVSRKMQNIILVCEGLDTIATIYVNGKLIGTSNNMFVRYTFDILKAVKIGENSIQIDFQSAVVYADKKSKSYSQVYPPVALSPAYRAIPNVQFVRKEACSFGYGLNAAFPTQGIWKDIYVESFDSANISYVTSETHQGDGKWSLNIQVFMDIGSAENVTGYIEVILENTVIRTKQYVTLNPSESTVNITVVIPETIPIKTWWPNGYGGQTLYNLRTVFTSVNGLETSSRDIKIGFRTVELVQDYVSTNFSQGRHFYFKINGVPIFVKGANWVPADSFNERITGDKIRNLLQSARDVHMNIIRIWGLGVYESDEFYELADELGIMIWQDLMFGCALYPTDAEFLDNIKGEITHQVRRLKHHASLIVWNGNNENEKALGENWYDTYFKFSLYHDDYVQLYIGTIGPILKREDPFRPFISSSPTNGINSKEQGWIANDPNSEFYGDIHEYIYLDKFYSDSLYRVPRLASEYGYESFPSFESLAAVFAEEDLEYWSDMNDYRQHHPAGNIKIQSEIIRYLQPPDCPDKKQRFKDLIYASQIVQAIGVKTETEHYRRWKNKLDSKGRGNTMGTMYWVLNDMWQAPTWSSLEYDGKWKMLHYYARYFYSPLLISPYQDNNDIVVSICIDQIPVTEHKWPIIGKDNQRWRNEVDGTLYIELYSWSNMTAKYTWKQPMKVNNTEMVFRKSILNMMIEANFSRIEYYFLYFHLGNPQAEPVAWLPLIEFVKAKEIQKANIQITSLSGSAKPRAFTITLETDAIAPFVWLDVPGVRGRFSDNGFLMVKPQKVITFYAWEDVDKETVQNLITVKSLMDIYYYL